MADLIGCVRKLRVAVVLDWTGVAWQRSTHTIHIVFDWPVELGGLPDTLDVWPPDCNAVEHAAAGLAVDSTLRSLAVEASIPVGRGIAFSADLVADTQTCVADSLVIVIVIAVAFAVQLVDGHSPCHRPDTDRFVHSPAFPIHPDRRDRLIHRVGHPSSTYCPQVIGMMDIAVVVAVTDVGHDVGVRMNRAVPLVLEQLHHIGSMHHCRKERNNLIFFFK